MDINKNLLKFDKELVSCAQLVNKLDDKMMRIYNN